VEDLPKAIAGARETVPAGGNAWWRVEAAKDYI